MSVRHQRHAWMVKERIKRLAAARKADAKAVAAFEKRAAEQHTA